METFLSKLPVILEVVGATVGLATVVVKLTDTPKDDEVVGKVRGIWYDKILPAIQMLSLVKKV